MHSQSDSVGPLQMTMSSRAVVSGQEHRSAESSVKNWSLGRSEFVANLKRGGPRARILKSHIHTNDI